MPSTVPNSVESASTPRSEGAESDLVPTSASVDATPVEAPKDESLTIRQETYLGPLPHPDHLRRFEEILPGAAERILRLTETQSSHRREMEALTVKSRIRLEYRGQWLAAGISFAVIGGGYWVISLGHSLEGVATMITAIAALAGVFIFGKRRQQLHSKANTVGRTAADSAAIPELENDKAESDK